MAWSARGSNQETEWQFATDDLEGVVRWLTRDLVAGYRLEPAGRVELYDTYFDTAGWHVITAGYTCRVRRNGEHAEATLKSTAIMADGLRQREEITEAVEPARIPDLQSLPGRFGEALRLILRGQQLVQLFDIHTSRELFSLADSAGTLGEVAIDTATIPRGDALPPERLVRIEVEVQSIEQALPFVEALRRETGVEPAPASKFEAALEATGQRSPLG